MTSVVRLAGTTDAVTTTFTYEPVFQQVASVTDPLSHATMFAYNEQGQLTTITDPLSHNDDGYLQPVGPTAYVDKCGERDRDIRVFGC